MSMTMMNKFIVYSLEEHLQEAEDGMEGGGWGWVVGRYMGFNSLFSLYC